MFLFDFILASFLNYWMDESSLIAISHKCIYDFSLLLRFHWGFYISL